MIKNLINQNQNQNQKKKKKRGLLRVLPGAQAAAVGRGAGRELVGAVLRPGVRGGVREQLNAGGGPLAVARYMSFGLHFGRVWLVYNQYMTRYGNDDLFHKLVTPLFMLGVCVMSIHLAGLMETLGAPNFPAFCVGAVWCSAVLIFMWARIAWHMRGSLRHMALLIGICPDLTAVLGWALLGAGVVPVAWRMTGLYTLFVVVFFMPIVPIILLPCVWPQMSLDAPAPCHKRYCCRTKKPDGLVGCLPVALAPLHIEPFTERFGCFTIIVLGELVDDISQNTTVHTNAYYATIALCFLIIYMFKLLHFDTNAHEDMNFHALRRDRFTGILWMICNFSKWGAYALCGSGLAMICEALNVIPSVSPSSSPSPSPHSGGSNRSSAAAAATHFANDSGAALALGEESEVNIEAARWLVAAGTAVIHLCTVGEAVAHRPDWDNDKATPAMRSSLFPKLKVIFGVQQVAAGAAIVVTLWLGSVHADDLSSEAFLGILAGSMLGLLVLGLWDESVEIDFNRSQQAAKTKNIMIEADAEGGGGHANDTGILSLLLPVGSEKTDGPDKSRHADDSVPHMYRLICREAIERCTEEELRSVLKILEHHVPHHHTGVKLASRHDSPVRKARHRSSSRHDSLTKKERRRSSLQHPPE